MFLGGRWSDGLGHMAHGGPRRREDPLELEGIDHIGIPAETVLLQLCGVVDIVAWGKDDRPHPEVPDSLHHVVIDGVDATFVEAAQALGADAAGEAPGRLGLSLLVGEPEIDLLECADPLLVGQGLMRTLGKIRASPLASRS